MPRQGSEKAGLNRNRRWLIVLAVAMAAVVLLAAFASRRREVAVRAQTAELSTITAAIDTDGKVEPLNNFEAHAPAAATVKSVLVHQGQQVKAGELLLRLDDADARAQAARALAQVRAAEADLNALKAGGTREEVLTTQAQLTAAQSELNAAEKDLETLRRLNQQGAASTAEVKNAEARVNAAKSQVQVLQKKLGSRFTEADMNRAEAQLNEAKAAYAAAQELLQMANVRSPRPGTVYSLPVRPGQYVNPGDLLVQVADLRKVQLRAFVDEPEIGRLRTDQQVIVTWNALPGKSWQGRITQLPSTVVTRGTRTVGEVTALIDNPNLLLLPNINVSVSIVTQQQENTIVLPREAVRGENSERYVFRIEDGVLKRQPVETGISNLTQVQITKGLWAGTEVATSSVSGEPLQAGMDVRVVQP